MYIPSILLIIVGIFGLLLLMTRSSFGYKKDGLVVYSILMIALGAFIGYMFDTKLGSTTQVRAGLGAGGVAGLGTSGLLLGYVMLAIAMLWAAHVSGFIVVETRKSRTS